MLDDMKKLYDLLCEMEARADEAKPADARKLARATREFVEAVGVRLVEIGAEKIASDVLIKENARLLAEVERARADERERCAKICLRVASRLRPGSMLVPGVALMMFAANEIRKNDEG